MAEPLHPDPDADANLPRRGRIKCLVWDLDHTLWQGVLSEGDALVLRPGVRTLIEALDARGILQSVASKNDADLALAQLQALGLAHFFLYPQIGWGPKSEAIARIAQALNIGIDSLAFIDDQAFERDEVAHSHDSVLCLDAGQVPSLAAWPEFTPRFITDESSRRRLMYQQDAQRQQIEEQFDGPKEDFLASLGMVFSVNHADASDLQRLEELTARTHQLNTTGRVYTQQQLDAFRRAPDHALLAASLDDRYGAYGKIGLALLHLAPGLWTIRLLLMSCRVMSRGVGAGLLGHIMRAAHAHGVQLRSEMIPNPRNRLMYATYRFAGFRQVDQIDGVEILQSQAQRPPPLPAHVQWRCDVETIVALAPAERTEHAAG